METPEKVWCCPNCSVYTARQPQEYEVWFWNDHFGEWFARKVFFCEYCKPWWVK